MPRHDVILVATLAGLAMLTLAACNGDEEGAGSPSGETTTTAPAASAPEKTLCQRALEAVGQMTAEERLVIAGLEQGLVRDDPDGPPESLQIVGVPRDSQTGDAYDYRFTPGGTLENRSPFDDYEELDRFPAALRADTPDGELRCEPTAGD